MGAVDNLQYRLFLVLTVLSLVILMPLGINRILHGSYLLGVNACLISAIFAFNSCSILLCRRYNSVPTSFVLVPCILFSLMLSLRNYGQQGILWSYPVAVSLHCLLSERQAWVANAVLLGIVLPWSWQEIEYSLALRLSATLLIVSILSIVLVRMIRVMCEQQRKLTLQATRPLAK